MRNGMVRFLLMPRGSMRKDAEQGPRDSNSGRTTLDVAELEAGAYMSSRARRHRLFGSSSSTDPDTMSRRQDKNLTQVTAFALTFRDGTGID